MQSEKGPQWQSSLISLQTTVCAILVQQHTPQSGSESWGSMLWSFFRGMWFVIEILQSTECRWKQANCILWNVKNPWNEDCLFQPPPLHVLCLPSVSKARSELMNFLFLSFASLLLHAFPCGFEEQTNKSIYQSWARALGLWCTFWIEISLLTLFIYFCQIFTLKV